MSKIRKIVGLTGRKLQAFRKRIIDLDCNQCMLCGSTKHLQVHHIQPVKLNTELAFDENNCITVCASCHKIIHTCRSRKK